VKHETSAESPQLMGDDSVDSIRAQLLDWATQVDVEDEDLQEAHQDVSWASSVERRGVLSEEFVRKQADLLPEEDVEEITSIVANSYGVTSLTGNGTIELLRLSNVEVVSLSNNALVDVTPLTYLTALTELNINFNHVQDLSPLGDCGCLEKLLAAHNQVFDISGLRECQTLKTLSLLGNKLTNLDSVVDVLQELGSLQALDLSENPCCRGPGARYTILDSLPELKSFDGKAVADLDRDLTAAYFEHAESSGAVDTRRPATAKARLGSSNVRSASPASLPLQGEQQELSQVLDRAGTCEGDPDVVTTLSGYIEQLRMQLHRLQVNNENSRADVRHSQQHEMLLTPLRAEIRDLEQECEQMDQQICENARLRRVVDAKEAELAALRSLEESADPAPKIQELKWQNHLLRGRITDLHEYVEQLMLSKYSLQVDDAAARIKSCCPRRPATADPATLGAHRGGQDMGLDLSDLFRQSESRYHELKQSYTRTKAQLDPRPATARPARVVTTSPKGYKKPHTQLSPSKSVSVKARVVGKQKARAIREMRSGLRNVSERLRTLDEEDEGADSCGAVDLGSTLNPARVGDAEVMVLR